MLNSFGVEIETYKENKLDNQEETSTEPQLSPEQLEAEKKRLLRFCNALFDTEHETLSKIIMHEYNYEFVFNNTNEERPTIKIISREWFDDCVDQVNELINMPREEFEEFIKDS